IYNTTLQYVEHFYPLWFTYGQSQRSSGTWIGPDRVGPAYHIVVLINVDTLYASMFADLSEPLIVTIPNPTSYGTNFHFSLLALDAYGDIFDTGITTGGTYGFTGPSYGGTLPYNVTRVSVPASVGLHPTLIIRADKYDKNNSGVYQPTGAEAFRSKLHAAPLSVYSSREGQCENGAGAAKIIPQVPVFALPFKSNADYLAQGDPSGFLSQLQDAVSSPRTPPLSASDQQLVTNFNVLFKGLPFIDPRPFMKAVRDAHKAIVDYIPNHATKKTNYWAWFDNIGGPNWSYLLRSAITEDCQYCNSHSAAAYFFVFRDSTGKLLDGSKNSYVLTFAKKQIPETQRFWSLTAYTPGALELIHNASEKYGVASYTPGLKYGTNGSVSIVMSATKPNGVPTANWLPIRKGVFMLGLRDYGPLGKVLANRYVPPAIRVYK
ncbi:MAG TPA: DUF1214 domain-containing protein, partial [Candidatus Baltobacteraceae bacterium]|nr:DUF1214 domain-containing protein [Candidatus Baltobacteraceae bacterium]